MEKKNSFKENFQPTIVLVAICLVITFLLAYVNGITAPIIAANQAASADAARTALLTDATTFTEYDKEIPAYSENAYVSEYYIADNGAGVVITVQTKSFGGTLTEMIGIDKTGAITGVKVTNHSDTKGLGTKAHATSYLDAQYKGKTSLADAANIKQDPSVSPVTGASVSSNGIYQGVCAALQAYKNVGLGGK